MVGIDKIIDVLKPKTVADGRDPIEAELLQIPTLTGLSDGPQVNTLVTAIGLGMSRLVVQKRPARGLVVPSSTTAAVITEPEPEPIAVPLDIPGLRPVFHPFQPVTPHKRVRGR